MAKSNWALDATHSSVDFTVKHMMFAKVNGTFEKFDATISADAEDLTTADISFTIDVGSVNTRNEDRDNHLRSADFFDAEAYPSITFASTGATKAGEGEYKLTGDLTIRGVTRSETFTVEYLGSGKDPWGNEKAGFHVSGTINRTNYGLKWNAVLETGGVLVGEDVKISLDIQAALQS